MRIILSPMGTDGDIRPFISLGTALKKAGNDIQMIIPNNAVLLAQKYDLPYKSIDFDYRDYIAKVTDKAGRKVIVSTLESAITSQFNALAEAAKGTDLIIGGAANYATGSIAELYSIPFHQVWHFPQAFKSTEHSPWRFKGQNYPKWINQIMWKINDLYDNGVGDALINKHRIRFGLKPLKNYADFWRKNIILAVDKELVSVPSDVNEDYIRTDYWHLFEEDELDQELVDFLNSGKPPVYFGLGSMGDHKPKETLKLIRNISETLDIRFVVQKGWAGYSKIDCPKIKFIDAVPHYKLFDKMSVIIHHGGSGTTHAAALSGTPQIIVPQAADQYYWGQHISRLGLGPKPVKMCRTMDRQMKSAIIQAISDDEIKNQCLKMKNALTYRDNMDKIIEQLGLNSSSFRR